jgi:hypothetical protein
MYSYTYGVPGRPLQPDLPFPELVVLTLSIMAMSYLLCSALLFILGFGSRAEFMFRYPFLAEELQRRKALELAFAAQLKQRKKKLQLGLTGALPAPAGKELAALMDAAVSAMEKQEAERGSGREKCCGEGSRSSCLALNLVSVTLVICAMAFFCFYLVLFSITQAAAVSTTVITVWGTSVATTVFVTIPLLDLLTVALMVAALPVWIPWLASAPAPGPAVAQLLSLAAGVGSGESSASSSSSLSGRLQHLTLLRASAQASAMPAEQALASFGLSTIVTGALALGGAALRGRGSSAAARPGATADSAETRGRSLDALLLERYLLHRARGAEAARSATSRGQGAVRPSQLQLRDAPVAEAAPLSVRKQVVAFRGELQLGLERGEQAEARELKRQLKQQRLEQELELEEEEEESEELEQQQQEPQEPQELPPPSSSPPAAALQKRFSACAPAAAAVPVASLARPPVGRHPLAAQASSATVGVSVVQPLVRGRPALPAVPAVPAMRALGSRLPAFSASSSAVPALRPGPPLPAAAAGAPVPLPVPAHGLAPSSSAAPQQLNLPVPSAEATLRRPLFSASAPTGSAASLNEDIYDEAWSSLQLPVAQPAAAQLLSCPVAAPTSVSGPQAAAAGIKGAGLNLRPTVLPAASQQPEAAPLHDIYGSSWSTSSESQAAPAAEVLLRAQLAYRSSRAAGSAGCS